jgi:large subunit ribosomal protein L25
MDTMKLSVHEREETGDGPARRLRAQGRIPGVTYAKGKAATSISLDLEELKAAMAHGHNVVLELDFSKSAKAAKGTSAAAAKGAAETKGKGKEARYAVVKQLQFHPVKRQLLHVDLHEVDLAVEIESPVSIEAFGTPAGLIDGGILDWERREVTVRALPGNMPAALELDVSGLYIGHHLSVAALAAPRGVTIVDDADAVLVALVPPRVEQAPVAEVAEEAAEPEVIGSQPSEEQLPGRSGS